MFLVVSERRAREREEPHESNDTTETHVRTQRAEQTCGRIPQQLEQKR